ncbi:MAG: hypothetical protein U1E60_17725 [Reyranellaceae bacterium]
MKRSIIALVAAMSVVGVAGATISMRPTEGGKSPLLATSTAPHVAVDRPSELRPNTVAKASPTEVQKAALEPLGTPVPLQLKSRVPAKLPDGDTAATPAAGDSGTVPPAATPDPAAENAARAAIEADGYKNVRIVGKGDGVFRAKALRGKTEVLLIVDATGSVTTAD